MDLLCNCMQFWKIPTFTANKQIWLGLGVRLGLQGVELRFWGKGQVTIWNKVNSVTTNDN